MVLAALTVLAALMVLAALEDSPGPQGSSWERHGFSDSSWERHGFSDPAASRATFLSHRLCLRGSKRLSWISLGSHGWPGLPEIVSSRVVAALTGLLGFGSPAALRPCRSRTGFTSCEPLPPPADYCGVGTAERRDRCSCPNPRSIMGPTQPSGFIAALAHLRPSMTGAALSWICASVRSLATLSVQRLQAPRGQSARPGFRASGAMGERGPNRTTPASQPPIRWLHCRASPTVPADAPDSGENRTGNGRPFHSASAASRSFMPRTGRACLEIERHLCGDIA
jgi:hypothetical protein